MSNITHDIVAKLWNLCNVLKDDGVTYHQYVTELTYLLFLKMAKETGTEDQLPEGYRWDDLEAKAAPDRLEFYKLAAHPPRHHGSPLVQEIFANASSFIKKPATLSTLVTEIDKLDWYSARQEGLGDLYEAAGEERQREEIRRRPVLHPAPAHRLHGRGDAAARSTTSSRTRPPAPAASSSPPTTTSASTATSTAGPRPSSASTAAAPSTAWSTCRTPTAWR